MTQEGTNEPVAETLENDIDQLVNEIDRLGPETAQVPLEGMNQPEAGDAPIEETLAHLKEDEAVAPLTLLRSPASNAEDKVQAANSAESEEGALTLQLSGKMKLNLSYQYSGQKVTVGFDEDALKVELEDGTEFKIPVKRLKKYSVAA